MSKLKEWLLWAITGWVLPVLSIVLLIVPTYLLGYFWMAVFFAAMALALGIVELAALRATGNTVTSNTAIKARKDKTKFFIVALVYFVFSALMFIHLYTTAFVLPGS